MARLTASGTPKTMSCLAIARSKASRTGSFALQHSGTMNRGAPSLAITVVPDSGTGELAGISGTMNIIIADGKHSYTLDYTLGAH